MATIRQQKLAKKISENSGMLMGQAMVEIGYSKAYAKSPDKLKNTAGWENLMGKYLPDDLLAKRHQELLNKRMVARVYDHNAGEFTNVVVDQPDTNAVKAGLDMGYKLKGKYKPITVKNELEFFLPDGTKIMELE